MGESKYCSKCESVKQISDFCFDKRSSDGRAYSCRQCQKKYRATRKDRYKWLRRQSYLRNQQEEKSAALTYYWDNVEKCRADHISWMADNKDHVREYARNYRSRNTDAINAQTSRRRAALLNATPPWLTKEHYAQMREFYTIARAIQEIDGTPCHVDHSHPLRHKDFCGLHVPWNLQILTASENSSKGNRWY